MPFVKKTHPQDSRPASVGGSPIFIGRTGELLFFVHHILKPEAPTHNILSISGQGGVGKSTLLGRFIAKAHEAPFKDYCLTATVDERQATPISMMEQLAQQLHLTGAFEKVLKQYKKAVQKRQVEWETLSNRLFERVPDVAGAVVEGIPVAGPLLREGAKFAALYLSKEYQASQFQQNTTLLETAVDDLTRAFVTELNRLADTNVSLSSTGQKRQRRIVLFFDTFEQLAAEAAPWFLDHFLAAQVSSNVVLVVAGRDPIDHTSPGDPKRWLPYCDDGTIYWISLDSFSEDETRMYLVKKGITDDDQIANIWHLSRGLPLYLGLLTSNPHGELDPAKGVVVNFLRWIPEQEQVKRRLALDGALFSKPFNLDDLEAFTYLSENELPILYQWLSEQPFVRSNTQDGRYIYHDLAKELFSRYLYQNSKKRYYTSRRVLAEHYQRLLEEARVAGDKGAYRIGEWLDLTIALAHQLLLLPDDVSHCKAIVQLLKASDYLDTEEQKGEMAKFLRELSQEQSTNLAISGARQVAEQMLQYIEAKLASQERLAAITVLLEKAVPLPSVPPELLAYLYSERGWAYFYLDLPGYQQAIADFEHALQLDPQCASAYNGRGWSYLNLNQYQQAKPDFDRAIELVSKEGGAYNGRGISAYNGRGIIYREFKEYRQAKAEFDRMIKLRPKNAWAYVGHGQTCTDLKEYQQAIADFEHALELDPSIPAAYEGLGRVYVELKEHQQAETIFEYLRGLHPESSVDYTQRGWAYLNLKEYQQAIADFAHALELEPNRVLAYGGRGWAYLKLKEYQLAIANFNSFIEIMPNNSQGYFQRGYAYLFLKDIGQARLDFTQSGELNLTNASGSWMAEWSGMCQEKGSKAAPERLEAIAAINPEDTTAHVCQGVALWLRGRFEEATAGLEQATLLDPERWDPFFWKGMICASLGQDEEAITAVEKALDLGLPPILLAPLRWFEQERPDFYEKHVVLLLAKHK